MEFPDAFTQRCAAPALLQKGFYHAHISVGNTFGCPAAVKHLNAFYDAVTAQGLARKVALIGISRGGLYCYRWAADNADRVAVIYGDAPVCDFKSWPGGRGKGTGSRGDWTARCTATVSRMRRKPWPTGAIPSMSWRPGRSQGGHHPRRRRCR